MKIGSLLLAAYAGLCTAQVNLDQDLIATDNSHNICLGRQGSPTLLNVTVMYFIMKSEDLFNITFSGEDASDEPPATYSCCDQCGYLSVEVAGTPENTARFLYCVANNYDTAKCGYGFPQSSIAIPDTPVPTPTSWNIVCLPSGRWTKTTLQAEFDKATPSPGLLSVHSISPTATRDQCTQWKYQQKREFDDAVIDFPRKLESWFNGCVENKLLPTCGNMWPADVYTYSGSSRYDVCLSKGGESTLSASTIASVKSKLEPFLQTRVTVLEKESEKPVKVKARQAFVTAKLGTPYPIEPKSCPSGSGTLEVEFAVVSATVSRFESCLADSSSADCNSFPDITAQKVIRPGHIIFRLDNVGEKDIAEQNREVIKTFTRYGALLAIGLIGGTTVFNEDALTKAAVMKAVGMGSEPLNMGDSLYNGNTETNVTAFVQRGEVEGLSMSTFAPISGRWDSQLLTTLKELEYRVISASAYMAPMLPTAISTNPMQLSAVTSAYMTDNGAWVPRSADAILTACSETAVCVVSIDVGNNKAKPTPEAVASHANSLISIRGVGIRDGRNYKITTFKEYWAMQPMDVKVCVDETWTKANLETDMGKFTGSAVATLAFTADTCLNVKFVTNKPAKLTTLKVLGKELDKVKMCLMDRSAAGCSAFPAMVYPYAMPMTYHVCVDKGTDATLTDTVYDAFVAKVQSFAETFTTPISREDNSPRCPANYGLVVLEFAATPMKRAAFEGCLDGKSSSCEGFPANASPVDPPPTPAPEDDGVPMWAIIVMAVAGGLCLCMTLVYFCTRPSEPHLQMTYGECGALDVEDEHSRPMHTHEYHDALQPAV